MPLVLERQVGESVCIGPACVLQVESIELPTVRFTRWQRGARESLTCSVGDFVSGGGVAVLVRRCPNSKQRVDLLFMGPSNVSIMRSELLAAAAREAVERAAGIPREAAQTASHDPGK